MRPTRGPSNHGNEFVQYGKAPEQKRKWPFIQRIQAFFTGRLEKLEQKVYSGERSENLITSTQYYVYEILSGRKGRQKQEAEMWMAKSGLRFDSRSKDVIYNIFELFEGKEREQELEERSARIRKDNESGDGVMNTFSKPANSSYSSLVSQKKRGNVDAKSQTQSHEQKNQSHDSVDPKNKNTAQSTHSTARKNNQTQSRSSNTMNSARAANSFRTTSQPFVIPSFTETVQGIAAQEAKSPETLEMEFQKRVQNTKDTYERMRQDAREVWKDRPEVLEMTLNSIDRQEKRDLEHEEQMYRKKFRLMIPCWKWKNKQGEWVCDNFIFLIFIYMGFWENTVRAFWQTPEDEERLKQFVEKTQAELQTQTAREIEQTQQSYAEILNQSQQQGEVELAKMASEQHAQMEQRVRELENSGVMSLGAGDENLELLRKLLEKKSRL